MGGISLLRSDPAAAHLRDRSLSCLLALERARAQRSAPVILARHAPCGAPLRAGHRLLRWLKRGMAGHPSARRAAADRDLLSRRLASVPACTGPRARRALAGLLGGLRIDLRR